MMTDPSSSLVQHPSVHEMITLGIVISLPEVLIALELVDRDFALLTW